MDALATEADLSARNIDITGVDDVTPILAAASAAIRDAAGCAISQMTSTITLDGNPSQWLALPLVAVSAVTSVEIDGVSVTDSLLREGRLWRACGWTGCWQPPQVTVTVTHGLDPVPADIVDLCCSLVAASLASTADGYDPARGLVSLGIDDYSEGYAQGGNEILNPLQLPLATRDWLRQRFGGATAVIGSY